MQIFILILQRESIIQVYNNKQYENLYLLIIQMGIQAAGGYYYVFGEAIFIFPIGNLNRWIMSISYQENCKIEIVSVIQAGWIYLRCEEIFHKVKMMLWVCVLSHGNWPRQVDLTYAKKTNAQFDSRRPTKERLFSSLYEIMPLSDCYMDLITSSQPKGDNRLLHPYKVISREEKHAKNELDNRWNSQAN